MKRERGREEERGREGGREREVEGKRRREREKRERKKQQLRIYSFLGSSFNIAFSSSLNKIPNNYNIYKHFKTKT